MTFRFVRGGASGSFAFAEARAAGSKDLSSAASATHLSFIAPAGAAAMQGLGMPRRRRRSPYSYRGRHDGHWKLENRAALPKNQPPRCIKSVVVFWIAGLPSQRVQGVK